MTASLRCCPTARHGFSFGLLLMAAASACGGDDTPASPHTGGNAGSGSPTGDAGPSKADSGTPTGAGGDQPNQPGRTGGRGGSASGQGGRDGRGAAGHAGDVAGQAGSDDAPHSDLHIESFPPLGAESSLSYRYRIVIDRAGAADFALTRGPSGASIDANGILTWLPSLEQVGQTHAFELTAAIGGDVATQSFGVSVSSVAVATTQVVSSDSDQSQQIVVQSPLSSAQGVTIVIPAGALSAETSMSIGIATSTPQLPAAGLLGESPIVMGMGPSGTVFNSPVEIVIPLSALSKQLIASHGSSALSAWTLGAEGRWQAMQIDQLDLDNGYVVLKAQHFSMFTVTAASPLLAVSERGLGGSACRDAMFVRAGLTPAAIDGFAAGFLNGDGASATTSALSGLLGQLPAGARLQIVLRAHVTTTDATFEDARYRVFTLRKQASGKYTLSVANGDGSVLFSHADLGADASEIADVLASAQTQFVFRGSPEHASGRLTLDAFAYLRAPDAGDGMPATEGQAFAAYAEQFADLTTIGGDQDCDGLLDSADMGPPAAPPPSLTAVSEPTVRALVDMPIDLTVRLFAVDPSAVRLDWSSDSAAVLLTADPDGRHARFASMTAGAHQVRVRATDTNGSATIVFTVFVDQPAMHNTLPGCQISAERTTLWSGESIALQAVAHDVEQTDAELAVHWTVAAGAQLSDARGNRVRFSAGEPGQYLVSCIANDGVGDGATGSVMVSVVPKPENNPPRLDFVTPTSTTLEVPLGELARQLISATASDPDGDSVSLEFSMLEGTATLTAAASGNDVAAGRVKALRRFETDRTGAFGILVRAIDERGAASEARVVKLLVVRSLNRTDNDQDGYPASVDCNDQDRTVYPGAPEICGDSVDQDCSGADRPASECDADRDGVSQQQGDCDDHNQAVFPGAFERCNGRDDNCNGSVDEGWSVSGACKVGNGDCAAVGHIVCSASGIAATCDAKPRAAVAETCNGKDDDCNGSIDDVPQTGALDVANCGGCARRCQETRNAVPSCGINAQGVIGCQSTCIAGYIDLDGSAENGCEYACAMSAAEQCNGRDDDCDGRIDEATSAPYYTGPDVTLGVGNCHAGLRVCILGELTATVREVVPADERCDTRDNDCDGSVDETFALGAACDGPDKDSCQNGKIVCTADGKSTGCGLETRQDIRDVCDGLDNDCDARTPDGSADAMLTAPCDQNNPDYCEPGKLMCRDGKLACSNERRDNTSCKACACDSTNACDTNGRGYYCSCDVQCNGPGVDCPCDTSANCDLLDGVAACGCDPQCKDVKECSCDQDPNKCDELPGGFQCACDHGCSAGTNCECATTSGVCDRTAAGDDCLCDADCYAGCPCDDGDPKVCAKDAAGNVCQCDPGCNTPPPTDACSCALEAGICDKLKDGSDCLCDRDCYPSCTCDDRNPGICAKDAAGNVCQCDPDCQNTQPTTCQCDVSSGVCDAATCTCDPDCKQTPPTSCACDASAGTCDKTTGGDSCLCDRDCYPRCPCDDADAKTCAVDSERNQCQCDTGCTSAPPTACTCAKTAGTCDLLTDGKACLCDRDCYPACPCDDGNAQTCAKDSAGNVCQCDPSCQTAPPSTGCTCDTTKGSCQAQCGCDVDCTTTPPPTTGCTCDTTKGSCQAQCDCDVDCTTTPPPATGCTCDITKGTCQPQCDCDVDCKTTPPPATGCTCDTTKGTCQPQCDCDVDCQTTPPPVTSCACDTTKGTCNGQCPCDPDCK